MKVLKQILLLVLVSATAVTINAQKLSHVLGEVLVEVRNDQGMRSLLSEINAESSYRSSLEAKQIMTQPMNLWVLSIDPNTDNEIHFLESVVNNRHALLAQYNHITQLRETIPNDTLFTSQWQYINTGTNGGVVGADIDIELAWDVTTGGTTIDGDEIVVCIIDDGINEDHPDLGDNLWTNTSEIADNGIDDDGNGYVDDVNGWNAYSDNDNVYTGGSHGTPVAGIVGAQGNNEIGVTGVNWDVKLMIVRGGSPESTALASYAYPYVMRDRYNKSDGAEGAFVVSTNASWGVDFGQPEDAPIWCDFYNLLGEVGILNFGATINGNTNVDEQGDLPTACSSDYLVSVTNMNRQDDKVNSAGFGKRTIDLGAFGEDTYTLSLNDYRGFGGTSGATPHCAGTAALLYAADCDAFMSLVKADPARAALAVKDYILHGVDPNESISEITTTGGRLNVNNAMQNLMSACSDCSDAYGLSIDDLTLTGGTIGFVDNGNIGAVSLRYRVLDDNTWTELSDVTNGQELSGLESCQSYEYQVKTDCNDLEGTYSYARVFETVGCCVAPKAIVSELVEDQINISWEELPFSSSLTLEYRLAGDAEWLLVEIADETSFTIPDVEDCRLYEFRLKSECAQTSNESEYSEVSSISTDCGACTVDYCEFGEKNTSDEWIQFVSIEGVFDHVSGPSDIGYDNNAGRYDIPLNQAGAYDITLVPGYSGSQFPEHFSVFIDFDQDALFSDEELVFQNTEETRDTAFGTILIPAEATLGVTRMRVVMRWNTIQGPCDDDDFEFGEIEDFCVTINPIVSADDVDILDDMTLSPNPASELVDVDFGYPISASGIVKILSSSGQLLRSMPVRSGAAQLRLDLSDLSAGVYIIELLTDKRRDMIQLVKVY